MIFRLILPDYAENSGLKKVIEGQFSIDEVLNYNTLGYNIYYLPNYPSQYNFNKPVSGADIDTFHYVFVDCDLKDGVHKSKEEFIKTLGTFSLPPTQIVDSGNGIHAYWKISDLDAKSYLAIQRRLIRRFSTDDSVATLYQLMRFPGTVNTKDEQNLKLCTILFESGANYTCEQLDTVLPILTREDQVYCEEHYNRTYKKETLSDFEEKIPFKFAELIRTNGEVKSIWAGGLDDRSKGDYRLGHIMFANGFSKEEATSVLVNSAKALSRAPIHRLNYAKNIIDKIWAYEESSNKTLNLSKSVRDILNQGEETIKGKRFPCHRYLDATHHGFRLGQVIGLVAGSGVGKTAMALNMFLGFVKSNPDHDHFFVPLEQPANEIADRWKSMCEGNTVLYDRVHVISNYDEDGSFRHLSFSEIEEYILHYQTSTGRKAGCIVIDHIGALKKQGKDGENQDLMTICHSMKAFAIKTNTLLVMQSQTSREKAGIGDLELGKDAAYGTVYFESYCDYLITIWQPLKRCYSEAGCPTVTAFKFCKIRHKKKELDHIQEDVAYKLLFDYKTERLRELTQEEEKTFDFYNIQALNKRKKDRKTDLVPYESITWTKENFNV